MERKRSAVQLFLVMVWQGKFDTLVDDLVEQKILPGKAAQMFTEQTGEKGGYLLCLFAMLYHGKNQGVMKAIAKVRRKDKEEGVEGALETILSAEHECKKTVATVISLIGGHNGFTEKMAA